MAGGQRVYDDPLETVQMLGWRIAWVNDMDGRVLLLDDLMLVLADPCLPREEVAERVHWTLLAA